MYALVVVEGPDAGARFPLPEREPQLIGRSTEAVPLRDTSVSRRHAELTPDAGRWWIRDLESRNGTYLNDARILERSPLSAGDRIRCGDTVLSIVHLDESARRGQIRALDPAREAVRIPDEPRLASDRLSRIEAFVAAERLDAEHGLPIACRLLDADEAALLEISGPENELGTATVRRADGSTPEDPFDLPRELVRTVIDDPGPRVAEILESRSIAAVCTRRPDGGGVILAASRSIERGWSPLELEALTLAAARFAITGRRRAETEDLSRLERLAAMGEATAALSHAIRNIVQGLRGGTDAVQLALSRERLDLAREGWAILARNLDRILALSLNMLAYSKDRELDLLSTDVARLVSDAIELLRTSAERARVELDATLSEDVPPIALDPDALHQIVVNLVRNAIDASPGDDRVSIRTRYEPDPAALILEVEDRGPGIPRERRDRVFEPFFSTKGQRGTGLGLAVARKLAERHGGSLDLIETPGPGALFRVTIPADRTATSDLEKTRGPNPIQGGDLGVRFEP